MTSPAAWLPWLALAWSPAAPSDAPPPPPAIVRVRVPEADVARAFPPGTEIVSMPADEADRLLARHEAARARAEAPPSRLTRATHQAQLEGGRLVGHSTFSIDRAVAGAAAQMAFDAWNVVVDAAETDAYGFRTDRAGALFLRVPPGPSATVRVGWTLPPRPRSDGRRFALRLPSIAPGSLELNLPIGMSPRPVAGRPWTPGAGTATGRSWTIEGAAGAIDLDLTPADAAGPARLGEPWVSGPTLIDVDGGSASWTGDWVVETGAGLDPLAVEFDRGLEPLGVTGPAVESYRIEAGGGVARLVVLWKPGVAGPTPIALRAVGRVPSGEAWAVPVARPVGAAWTGGTVTVRVARSTGIRDVQLLQGRSVDATGPATPDRTSWAFEPASLTSPAVFTLGPRAPIISAEVRGLLRTEGSRSRFVAEVAWQAPPREPSEPTFDVPAGWAVDRVAGSSDEPMAWHAVPIAGGGVRIRVAPQAPASGATLLVVSGNRLAQAGGADFEAPRVRPVGATSRDETWAAVVDGDRAYRAAPGSGLAWLRPASALGPRLGRDLDPAVLRRALAWRWTRDDGRLAVGIVEAPREARSSASTRADVRADGGTACTWRVAVRPGTATPNLIPIQMSRPAGPVRWRLGVDGDFRPAAPRPLTPIERADAGFDPDRGVAIGFDVPAGRPTALELIGVAEGPAPIGAEIPLVDLPGGFHPERELVVSEPAGLRACVDVVAMDEVVPDPDPSPDLDPPASRRFVFVAGGASARVSGLVDAGDGRPAEILSATLGTGFDRQGGRSESLAMSIRRGDAAEIRFAMPPGSTIERLTVGGRPTPIVEVEGGGHAIPLAGLAPGSVAAVSLLWHTAEPADPTHRGGLRPLVPRFREPCARFAWVVRSDEATAFKPGGGALVPAGGSGRFEREGWPDAGDWIAVRRGARGWIEAAVLGLDVLALAYGVARRGRTRRTVLVVGLLGLYPATIVTRGLGDGWLAVATLGALGAVAASVVTARRGRGLGAVALAVVVASTAGLAPDAKPAAVPDAGPIVVVYPIAAGAGPDRPGATALMAAPAYRRLVDALRLAEGGGAGRLYQVEAAHSIARDGPARARVATDAVFVSDDAAPADWTIDLGVSSDVTLRVDGRAAPIRALPGGRMFRFAVQGAGRHTVRIERTIARGDGAGFVLPLIPAARQTFRLEPPGAWGPLTASDDRGAVAHGPGAGTWAAGPAVAVEARPAGSAGGDGPAAGPGVVGLFLWDARPSGDLVRIEIRPEGDAPVSELTIVVPDAARVHADPARAVEPGARRSGDRWAWSSGFSPPIRRDRPATIDVWVPRPAAGAGSGPASSRILPEIAVAGLTGRGSLLALRRPPGRAGRLRSEPAGAALDESAFRDAWAGEPAETGGVVAFDPAARYHADLAFDGPPLRARPSVVLKLAEGRYDLDWKTELDGLGRASGVFDLRLPAGLTVDRFDGGGVVDASPARPDRLRLVVHGDGRASNAIRLVAHGLVDAVGLPTGPAGFSIPVPWPSWEGVAADTGILTVESLGKLALPTTDGLERLHAAEPFQPSPSSPMFRAVFHVRRAGDLGGVSWQGTNPVVSGVLKSRVELLGARARLAATVQYEIAGGPVDAVRLKVPSAWASNPRIELVGRACEVFADLQGDATVFTLRPSEPLWGAARLVYEADTPFDASGTMKYPDLAPLGYGTVEKSLAVVNATAARLSIVAASGLQTDDDRPPTGREPAESPRARRFRVASDHWSLSLRLDPL